MLSALARLVRLYLQKFPIEPGKWRLWTLIHPYLKPSLFKAGSYSTLYGFDMELNPEKYIERFIYYWGLWEPDETYFISSVLRKGDRFVDLGANTGFFTLLASMLVGAEGQVQCFEPVPTTAENLRRNITRNQCGNVTVYECAATNQETTIRINKHGSGDTSDQNSMRPSSKSTEHWSVRGVRLDDVLEPGPPIRLIKMDVEGAEFFALQGAAGFLNAQLPPLVLCEITDRFLRDLGSSAKDVYELMASFGYAYAYDCHNKRLTLLSPRDKDAAIFQRNVVFSKAPLHQHDECRTRRSGD